MKLSLRKIIFSIGGKKSLKMFNRHQKKVSKLPTRAENLEKTEVNPVDSLSITDESKNTAKLILVIDAWSLKARLICQYFLTGNARYKLNGESRSVQLLAIIVTDPREVVNIPTDEITVLHCLTPDVLLETVNQIKPDLALFIERTASIDSTKELVIWDNITLAGSQGHVGRRLRGTKVKPNTA